MMLPSMFFERLDLYSQVTPYQLSHVWVVLTQVKVRQQQFSLQCESIKLSEITLHLLPAQSKACEQLLQCS